MSYSLEVFFVQNCTAQFDISDHQLRQLHARGYEVHDDCAVEALLNDPAVREIIGLPSEPGNLAEVMARDLQSTPDSFRYFVKGSQSEVEYAEIQEFSGECELALVPAHLREPDEDDGSDR